MAALISVSSLGKDPRLISSYPSPASSSCDLACANVQGGYEHRVHHSCKLGSSGRACPGLFDVPECRRRPVLAHSACSSLPPPSPEAGAGPQRPSAAAASGMIHRVPPDHDRAARCPRCCTSAGRGGPSAKEAAKVGIDTDRPVCRRASWPSRSMCRKERAEHQCAPPVPNGTAASDACPQVTRSFSRRAVSWHDPTHRRHRCRAWHGAVAVGCRHATHEHLRIAQGRIRRGCWWRMSW